MADRRSAALSSLTLTNFRNYEHLDLAFSKPLIAFVGDNGIGKTNILEAISFLTAGRGLRRAPFADVGRMRGPGSWSVSTILNQNDDETRIGTGLTNGEAGRRVRIDGEDVRSSEALLDYMRVLWLVPSMDGLFTGPGSDRRRFLDRLTLAIDPTHGRRVSNFEKALRQRNKLLDHGGSSDFLSAIETQVAELGTAVSLARSETVTLLGETVKAQAETGLPFPLATLTLDGAFEMATRGMSASDREDHYRDLLSEGRGRDRAVGRTLMGPHLSDLIVRHAAKDMPAAQSSTGEQKALLIGLVLAHAELTASITGMTPVLLLDEIAAHLDPNRRKALFTRLLDLGGQVFMTGTDASLFEALPQEGEVFEISPDGAALVER
ncbi:DNA replication/repair protein RecF [Roseibium polysiphoniae]|uniref:DNA replication and repair protein RecF n=1 Tax=Roseibium polysiphoniae TaxID=2571221 RepID=A0ABR9CFK2_9HYPH|nr:DNA replication/repair protein RecF [Roseibium polysiphoniae]MBD8878656.1 DNA replication/repair protein RecF [Roseibium polysiphoniae]